MSRNLRVVGSVERSAARRLCVLIATRSTVIHPVAERNGHDTCAMLCGPMPRTDLPAALLLAASLTFSCGPPRVLGRPTTIGIARSDDPWLLGRRCTPETPADTEARTEVLAAGTGDPVGPGMTVRVHYIASLPGGAVLHDTHDENMPSEIIIGSTKTICGFERSLIGMHPGEQRRVFVPSSLAFGESERPTGVPPNTDLVFVIDLYLPADVVNQHGSAPVNPNRGGGRRR